MLPTVLRHHTGVFGIIRFFHTVAVYIHVSGTIFFLLRVEVYMYQEPYFFLHKVAVYMYTDTLSKYIHCLPVTDFALDN